MTKDERVDSPYFVLCQVAELRAEGLPWEELLDSLDDYLALQDAHFQTLPETPLTDLALEALALLSEGSAQLRRQEEETRALELAEQGQELWDEAMLLAKE